MAKEQYFPFPRELDPHLYDLYVRMLPVRGWAGQLSKEERKWLKNRRKQGSAKLAKGGEK